jgi:hypothetical protein
LRWVESLFCALSPWLIKSPEGFKDCLGHFKTSLFPLSTNVKQVELNEKFIFTELQKWKQNQLSPMQKLFLLDKFQSVVEILLHTPDVMAKFS